MLFSLSRRVVHPEASLIPFQKSLQRIWETHTVGGNVPKYLGYSGGGSPTSNWHTNPQNMGENTTKPAGLLGLLKPRAWGSMFTKASTRTVSDAEIAATKSPKNAPLPTAPKPDVKAPAPRTVTAQSLHAEVLPDEPLLEEKKGEEHAAQTPAPTPAPTPDVAAKEKDKPKTNPTEDEAARIKDIMHCLKNERLRLFFQPIVDINSNQRVMFETFLRLVKDNGDLMMPGEFIPLAIKHGFIGDIDDAVIAASLRRHMEILTQGKATTLSINLSYGAFASHQFMETFELGLASGRIKPQYINFEVSSRELIEDQKGMAFIRDMRENGCKFSVDFFGDLRVVEAAKRMGFNYMKVDCLRFRGLEEGDPEQVAAFRNLVVEAQKHDLPLIAEKVENKAVWWLCKRLGVPMVQGYYIAEPSPRLELGW